MGTLSRMKQIVAHLLLLLALLVTVSGQDTSSVRGRVQAQMKQWASVLAHCAEASNTEGQIEAEAALECKRCQAGVGDWNNPEGFQRGKACLETWEPKTLEVCGDLFQEYEDSDYDVSYAVKMVECWENTYKREIARKCLEATGGEDMNLALLCVFKHLTDNHKHTEKVLFGSSDDDPMKPSKMQLVIESIFNEGRCLHANEGNMNRIQECNMCFNNILMKEKKLIMKMKFQKKHGMGGLDEEEYFEKGKRLGSMWAVCSDVYLAPVYSDCTENIDQIFQADMEDWATEEFKAKLMEVEACMVLKQSQYYYKDCSAAGGEGVDGFMNFFSCAQNLTLTWVTDKRPEALDMMADYMRGGRIPFGDEEP